MELSVGWRHVAALAMTLLLEPRLLLMDEPFSSVDDFRKGALWQRMRLTAPRDRRLEIVVTHDISEAVAVADEIIVFDGPPLHVIDRLTIDIEASQDRTGVADRVRTSLARHGSYRASF